MVETFETADNAYQTCDMANHALSDEALSLFGPPPTPRPRAEIVESPAASPVRAESFVCAEGDVADAEAPEGGNARLLLGVINNPQDSAAMLGMFGLFSTLRNFFGTRPAGASSDLVPHLNGQRFNVPLGAEVTLRSISGEISFFDGAATGASTEIAVLCRTERGWTVRSVGSGFSHQPEGSTEFTPVRAGTSVVLGANDQIRLGSEEARILTFRAEAQPAPVEAGQTQMRVTTNGRQRTVEITRPDGTRDSVQLVCSSGWATAMGPTGSHESPIKVHIGVQNATDLARIQPAVIDALRNDPVLRRLVTGWKTMDPCHALNETARVYGVAPSGQGQGAKGFTIYCANAENALLIQQRLSQILAERGLGLPAPVRSGNVDSVDALTNRVGVVRDSWPITSDARGQEGYLLDVELSRRVHDHFQRGNGQFLSAEQRRQLERDLGLRPNTVTYDHADRLMMRATSTSHLAYHGAAYATESGAVTAQGLADRPALYALYRRFQLDPAEQARASSDRTASRPSGVPAENLQREFTQIAERLNTDPFLRNTAISEFSRRMTALENQLRTISDPAARTTAIQTSFQQLIRDVVPTANDSFVARLGRVTVVSAPELDMNGAPQGRQVMRLRDGTVIEPMYVDGNDMMTRSTDLYGRPANRRVPLSSITLELQVPSSTISADLSTDAGAGQFRRMVSTVYEQLDRTHRLGSLSRTESTNPQLLTAISGSGDVIGDYLHRELHSNGAPVRPTDLRAGSMTEQQRIEARAAANVAGIPLAGDQNMRDFVNRLTNGIADQQNGWRDNLTARWEAGTTARAEIQQSYDRVLELARQHLQAAGQNGPQLEQAARQMVDSPSGDILNDRQFTAERDQYMHRRTEYLRENGAMHQVLEQRQQRLQESLNQYCRDNNLPPIRIRSTEFSDATDGYDRGTGTIRISPSELLSRSQSPHTVASIATQVAAAQADRQIVRSLIDRVNGSPAPGQALSAVQIELIRTQYRQRTGGDLAPAFLEAVTQNRSARLTPAEVVRADAMATSLRDTRAAAANYDRVGIDLRAVQSELNGLRTTTNPQAATDLMARLRPPAGEALCQRWFGVNNVNELAAGHPLRALMERYMAASTNGSALPAPETAAWSEQTARQQLLQVLVTRETQLTEQRAQIYREYQSSSLQMETYSLSLDARERSSRRLTELPAPAPTAGTSELHTAEQNIRLRQQELQFLDLLHARLRELFPNVNISDLRPAQVREGMVQLVESLDQVIDPTARIHGEQLTAEQARQRAEAGQRVVSEFTRAMEAPSGSPQARLALERVQHHLNPPTAQTPSSEIPHHLMASATELARLDTGRPIIEYDGTNARVRREGAAQEVVREISEQDVRRGIDQEIRRMEEESGRRELNPSERAVLEHLRQTRTRLNDPGAMQAIRETARPLLGRSRAAAGSTIGMMIIISSALGWYVRTQHGGQRPAGLSNLSLPGC